MSWSTIYLLISTKHTLGLPPASSLLFIQAELKAHTHTHLHLQDRLCPVYGTGDPKLLPQPLCFTSQQWCTHTHRGAEITRKERERRAGEGTTGQAGHSYWNWQEKAAGLLGLKGEAQMRRRLMEVSPQLSLGWVSGGARVLQQEQMPERTPEH